MSDRGPEREVEQLRRENAALNEQIKLLVQTEQRLYRSENQLDVQLVRLRSLARFALESTGVESASLILDRALGVLAEGFRLDWVGVVRLEPSEQAVTLLQVHESLDADAGPIAVEPEAWKWLSEQRDAVIVGRALSDAAIPVCRLMGAIAPDVADKDDQGLADRVACLPLHSVGDVRPGALLAFAARRSMVLAREDVLDDRHLPFLQLLANHVDHEIENVRLTASLSERSAELASSLATLEATQAELLQAQKLEAIGRLAGGVAHDFNNLLTVILGYAETLRASLHPDAPEQHHVARILDAGRRTAGITAQLLALGRRQLLRREPLNLSDETARTVELLQRIVGEDIRLEIDLSHELASVTADRAQVEQVLLNLVANGRDAMPEGGAMWIRTRAATPSDASRCDAGVAAGAYAVLEVEDTGSGMDEATQERIFEPFYTTKGVGKGTGLGLAVVYGIVKQSEGHVLVESRVGSGTRFTVLLPYAQAVAAVTAGEAPKECAAQGEGGATPRPGATVLVVEDEGAIREVVVAILRRAGHVVLEAGDGEDALRQLASMETAPDLILTDVVMPRLGGLKLAEDVARRWPSIRMAFMSGYSEPCPGEDGLRDKRGAAFLAKPFSPADLLAFVGLQLDRVAGARA